MKPDLPIIGERKRGIGLVSWSLFAQELEKIIDNEKAIADRLKIHELRKSCGVEDKILSTINIRRPPRYKDTLK